MTTGTPFLRADSGNHYSASLPPRDVLDAARCAQADPEEWFPETGQNGDYAKRICSMCPAQTACLEWALETRQNYGIWGGLSAFERRTIHEKRAAAAKESEAADPQPDRAAQVAELTAAGWTATQIANELGITPRTVQRDRARNRQQEAA